MGLGSVLPEHLMDHVWALSCIPNKLSAVCTAEAAVSNFFLFQNIFLHGRQEEKDKIWLRPALQLTMSAVSCWYFIV